MSDLLDDLTADLGAGLKPVKPMRVLPLWAGACVGLLLAAIYIWFFYGPRPELSALTYGNWSGNNMSVLKPLMFLALGLGALWGVSGLVRPEGRPKLRYMLPVLMIGGIVLGSLLVEYKQEGWGRMTANLSAGVAICYTTILCGGMAGLIVLWRFWLRRSATSHPVILGAMSGLATASLMASAYALHCQGDAPIYLLLVYGAAVAILTGIAALLGGKLLRW
jgi:hypothetical protein